MGYYPEHLCCLECKETKKKEVHIDSVFIVFCDNCFQGVSQLSQLMGDKLEKQSSTFCLPHCTRAQLQHACLPQQNEKSIHVSRLPHLLQDNWPWHHDLSVWVILFPLGWARGKRHIFQSARRTPLKAPSCQWPIKSSAGHRTNE